jgi:hypothetical protein
MITCINSIKWLGFVMEKHCVLCEEETELLNII